MILSRLCDYAAAREILRQKSESCPDDDDWESFLNDLGRLLEDDSQWCSATTNSQIHPPVFLACKVSKFFEDESVQYQFATTLSEALTLKLAKLPVEYDGLDTGANEYFNSLSADAKVSLHVTRKSEELQLINNLRGGDSSTLALRAEVSNLLKSVDERSGYVSEGESDHHGTSIALKTNRFIILAADGKLTTTNISKALNLKADKVLGIGDMGVAITGCWKTLSNTVSMLRRWIRNHNDKGLVRPTVPEFASFMEERLSPCREKSGIIFAAFDQLEDGLFVPCISFVDEEGGRIDVDKAFFCAGTGESHAKRILEAGNVHMDMSLDEAINLVERALVYANRYDGCTGGWASIYVIEVGKPARALPREHICTTLWRRHHLSFPISPFDGAW
ncbi:hypothetical protein MKW94_021094 [Papaver nudicaule]|uniref:Uncharacterized protein n=1 Tax=Papaver nudicaule TaxID=74823 RepID=A0AA41S4H1_PAPNU|nr:hypothetical protein [Papaver nudicaule]